MEMISVIVPIYNVEKYLEKCVNSIILQTYKDLEIILVDDGSTDGSGELCDTLQDRDNRIRVFHQKNMGLSVARNTGLDNATGDWILFLDSDDWIENNMLEVLHSLANQYQADISSCASRNVKYGESQDCLNDYSNDFSVFQFNSEEMIIELFTQKNVRFEVWNKLWKRSVIGETRFIPGQISEDVHFDRLVFLNAKKMVHTTQVLHNYLISRPGNTRATFKIARICIFEEFDSLLHDISYNEQLVLVVNSIAANFAIYMYDEAYRKRQSKEIKKLLHTVYNKYYPVAIKGNYIKKRSARLFRYSPKLYCILLHIKRKIKGL